MIKKLIWNLTCDRLGPDVPVTHMLLYSKRLGSRLCKNKFGAFGDNSEFRPHAFASNPSKIFIGNNVVVRPNCMFFADETPEGNIIIEDNVLLGSGIHIYVNNHKFENPNQPIIHQGYYPSLETKICRGAWIGANAILLPGVTVGENAVVGAGSIVTTDVESGTVVAGNPARRITKSP